MVEEDLEKEESLTVTTGHLIYLWDLVSKKIASAPLNEHFTETEKHAIWALEDILERKLINCNIGARPEAEWEALVQRAGDMVKAFPLDCID